MKTVAISLLVALGGCSLTAQTRHPHRERSGQMACQSYALPIIDTVIAAPLLPIGALGIYLGATDRELRSFGTAGVIILALAIPAAISAVVGYRDIPRCNRELDALPK